MDTNQTPRKPSGRQYNRPAQEAKRLGICRRELSNWMNQGIVPFLQIGRVILFNPDAVDAALEKLHHSQGH